jgi:hypothetical protein
VQKIGINIDEESQTAIVEGKSEPIDKIFMRIERYMKIIAGADFLKFENINPEDIQDLYYEIPILRTSTEITLDELMSARQNTMALFE